jgi:hypothetical protein
MGSPLWLGPRTLRRFELFEGKGLSLSGDGAKRSGFGERERSMRRLTGLGGILGRVSLS